LLFLEHKLGKLFDYHKLEEISKLFENYYSEEVIKKVKNFYFNEHEQSNDITKLENTCRVSTLYFYFIILHWNTSIPVLSFINLGLWNRFHVIFVC
jgi:hypothetical protein